MAMSSGGLSWVRSPGGTGPSGILRGENRNQSGSTGGVSQKYDPLNEQKNISEVDGKMLMIFYWGFRGGIKWYQIINMTVMITTLILKNDTLKNLEGKNAFW